MNAALDAMERDGTAERIRRKYDSQAGQTARH